ncbi:MAG: glycosyl hydrolase 115 family protein [Bacteroidota bacterium]
MNYLPKSIFKQRLNFRATIAWLMLVAIPILSVAIVAFARTPSTTDRESYVSPKMEAGSFTLSASSVSTPLCVSSRDFPGVLRAAKDLAGDIESVTTAKPQIIDDAIPSSKEIVLIGTIGKNSWIDTLISQNKINVEGVAGKWETFILQVVEKPFAGVDRALVIAGSDKRGTIFGLYDLSSHIGVSPWYWWADVPAQHRPSLYVLSGRHTQGEPAVKYRGFFINDEAPALSGWAVEKFGGFNSAFYAHVFELILRLKGNYLWPAMWGKSFFDDDSLNFKLADEYGVVIGTSHHEPMMRAQEEWHRYGSGPWNYEKNESVLKNFWTKGIQRMGSYESIVTIGMRGDGDMPMTEGSNIALLEKIVKDQRDILGAVTGKDVTTIPQDWALYKEVQDYYDKGMRVPDDVTLLLCDDNWGNIRKLPRLGDKPRTGGYGIYYHYDYVGGPRNYKWLNTNQIERTWEQMHLAYAYGARQIWIVNVGDIKPMEFPLQFFLDYAWDPDAWPAARLPEYTRLWAEQQFGKEHAAEIADIVTSYTKFNARRKPELLSPDTYSLFDYREAETVVADYNALAEKAQHIYDTLPSEYKDAYYQLVLQPVLACANLNELYVTVAKNRLYAKQGRAATDSLAQKAVELFGKDSAITYYYNKIMAGGKWDHMMDQTHIGYTYWQEPPKNSLPEVKKIDVPAGPEMGVALEGQSTWLPGDGTEATLPEFDRYNKQSHYIEIFNRGKTPFGYSMQIDKPWMKVSNARGTIDLEDRLWLSVDWAEAPAGKQLAAITVTGPNNSNVVIHASINNPPVLPQDSVREFVESDGCISVEAEHYSRAVDAPPISWLKIPGLGRTLSAMTPVPVTSPPQSPGGTSPHLEYTMLLFSTGQVSVKAYLSPTLNFHNDQGLRYAVSFDDEPPQTIIMNGDNSNRAWEQWVANNINVCISHHNIQSQGVHKLKFWMVDPGVVLQKIVVDAGGVKPSYLGPPESYLLNRKN